MSEVTLQQYLEAFGLDLNITKLHVIREPKASMCWEQFQTDEDSDIANIAKIETACNPKSHWINTTHIAVLLDCGVKNSPYHTVQKSYLFVGVLEVLGRKDGFDDEDGGNLQNPAWNLEYTWVDNQYLFINPTLATRGYHFHALGDTTSSVDKFTWFNVSQEIPENEGVVRLLRGIWKISSSRFGIETDRVPMAELEMFMNNFTGCFNLPDQFRPAIGSSEEFEVVIESDGTECLQFKSAVGHTQDMDFRVLLSGYSVVSRNQKLLSFWVTYLYESFRTYDQSSDIDIEGIKSSIVFQSIVILNWTSRILSKTPRDNVSRDLATSKKLFSVKKRKNINFYSLSSSSKQSLQTTLEYYSKETIINLNEEELLNHNSNPRYPMLDSSGTKSKILSPITPHPVSSQINAMYRLPDEYFLQEMIDCHREGITTTELVADIVARGNYTQAYLPNLPYSLNKGYHFFGLKGQEMYANEVSQAYSEGDTEPLMVVALQNFYLLAEVLEWVNRNPKLRLSEIFETIRSHYPRWGTDKQPSERIWWLRFFGLVTPTVDQNMRGKKVSITEKGQQVLSRLNFEGRELISAPVAATDNVVELQEPTYSDLLAKISDDSMIIDESQIKGIHNGFHANTDKRFIILSGLSGTGKTKLLQEYANAYCELMDLDPDEHVELVSITPAFRDHTPLLGYLNPLTNPPRYIPGELTDFLLAAEASPELPFFLILDEMNLARVEFYLAPILSGMESSTRIAFHDSEDVDFPNGLKSWPSNVFMAGTVNMDETTHAFSDKVLDRAFTLEFWKIDLPQYFIQNPTLPAIQDKITQIYNILEPAHLHFGYRTVKAIVDYVERAMMTDANDLMDALDQGIFSKVLPKIRGQKSTLLTSTLATLLQECLGLSRSESKIQQMQTRLKETGLTRFWR